MKYVLRTAVVDSDLADPLSTRRILVAAAMAAAGLSCLVIVAMWMGVWLLSPCLP